MAFKGDPVFLEGEILHMTNQAVLFIFGGAGGKEVWIPKSQLRYCSLDIIGKMRDDLSGATAEIEIPLWFAESKGLA